MATEMLRRFRKKEKKKKKKNNPKKEGGVEQKGKRKTAGWTVLGIDVLV
jgi:hypothetical protein